MKNTAIIKGSLSALAQANNQSLAETFVNCDVIVIVDVSGSMASGDGRGGRSRYDVACEELAKLQANLPGKIGVFSFSDYTSFCPGGVPIFSGNGTNMAGALQFCKVADVPGMRFILISDGMPDDRQGALFAARSYKAKIDTIFVGPEGYEDARKFLEELAAASGGQAILKEKAAELASGIQFLLTG